MNKPNENKQADTENRVVVPRNGRAATWVKGANSLGTGTKLVVESMLKGTGKQKNNAADVKCTQRCKPTLPQ